MPVPLKRPQEKAFRIRKASESVSIHRGVKAKVARMLLVSELAPPTLVQRDMPSRRAWAWSFADTDGNRAVRKDSTAMWVRLVESS